MRVLITTQDLEPAVRLRDAFQDAGYSVELMTPGERIAEIDEPKLLILTGALNEKQAKRLAREAAAQDGLPVIALFDRETENTPDARTTLGVAEALVKPVDIDDVVLIGRRLIDRQQLRELTGIIGESDAMVEVLERVIQIAPVSSTVLLTGESGTGKERVSRGIHALSPRKHKPFIAANVAALPETLLESELFGHEKGSFTGAIGQRKGLFELAHKGTLFLDEIGEMPTSTQTKLLRVLEEREFMRLGGEVGLAVDVRVIAATNQDLPQLVQLGRFRRDLYFRLNVLNIYLPPLRARRGDIPLLVGHFIREASREHDRPPVAVSPEALDILMEYEWPGNVRELKNLIESMVVLSPGGVIRPEDIPREIREGSRIHTALPVPIGNMQSRDGTPGPELEFIFHTLLQLQIDIDDLRRQFEAYRRTHEELPARQSFAPPYVLQPADLSSRAAFIEDAHVEDDEEDLAAEHEVVVYRPGMTLKDLECAAITAALREVAGNRRKAAEMLGMGERTLYRKIKEYDIPI